MKRSFLILLAVISLVLISCGEEELPEPNVPSTQNTEGGGDDGEDPIIQN